MEIKRGLILAGIYLLLMIITSGLPYNDNFNDVFIWFVFVINSIIFTIVTVLIGWKFFGLDFLPWGLIIILLSLPLSLILSPIAGGLINTVYVAPALLFFLIGTLEG
ncbi:hypothetical protein [Pyrococcus kukulkanii]|uniref:hypothetical protein n=1 Tax=Pyrococcus kukulkanii TaxID=1609559 RepID=UPI0035663345